MNNGIREKWMTPISTCTLLLSILFVVILSGCQSDAAKAMDAQINAIGEVTLDSLDAIESAEQAYNSLDEKDQKQVKSYSVLEDARSTYTKLRVNEVNNLIEAIGQVTLDSKNSIFAAEKAYRELTDEEKDLVINFDTLKDAWTEYDKVRAKDVEKKLDEAIRDTSKMNSAMSSYRSLSSTQQGLVKNYAEFQTAKKAFDQENLYSTIVGLVNKGNYTKAVQYLEQEALPLDYSDIQYYYNYAQAMKLYLETEFLKYEDILAVVDYLTESAGFKDSDKIRVKIQTELQRLTGTHKHKRNSRYLYDAYYLIISDNGDVALDMGKSSTGPSLGTYFDYRLAYVNLEKSSFYVLCANYPQDIDHVSYGITLNSTYITLSKAWGSIDNGLFAANYS